MADNTEEHLRHNRAPLAYENKKFLNGPEGRILRILAEYQEPLSRFRRERIQDTIVFFGSARFHSRSQAEEALQLLDKPGSAKPAPRRNSWHPPRPGRCRDGPLLRRCAPAGLHGHPVDQDHQPAATSLRDCTGGGPGIMEAANLGASEAGGKTIGLNINLPFEQMPNPYITPELNFEFHYFFMRKLWFAYLSKALVVFPGGFGTFDELFELLTLAQTEKLAKRICIVVYGKDYWDRVVNFQALVDGHHLSQRPGTVSLGQHAGGSLRVPAGRSDQASPGSVDAREKEPEIAKTRP